jgi:cytosine deaminase
VLRTGYQGGVLCGHCCSLANQPDEVALATLDRVAQAGLNVVSLPMCNLYLQDRHAARTPRWRGITLVHEMAARGTRVSFASDNTRDPFYAYGDLDMLEVVREATRIAHLDHPFGAWPAAFSRTPAAVLGVAGGVIGQGAPADLVIVPARRWTELLSRPHADRQVIRAGRPISARPLDYAVLDPLMEPK